MNILLSSLDFLKWCNQLHEQQVDNLPLIFFLWLLILEVISYFKLYFIVYFYALYCMYAEEEV